MQQANQVVGDGDESRQKALSFGEGVVTLLVRHLPEALSPDTLQRLFSHYGAIAFRPCVAGRLKNCAFVDFKDEGLAARAQSHLHRLHFMGKILTVEKAKPVTAKEQATEQFQQSPQARDLQELPPLPPYPPPAEEPPPPYSNAPLVEHGSSVLAKAEPIAPRLGIDYSFPPQLEYAYPPPDGNILTNIVNALIAVPRFYTQVLHLMNKMNLPAPFRPALPTPPLPPPLPVPAPPKSRSRDLSSDESELESSEEVENSGGDEDIVGVENENDVKSNKRAKREAILGPGADKAASHESAGLRPIVSSTKSMHAIKKKQPVLQIKIVPKGVSESVSKNLKMNPEVHAEQSQDEIKEQRQAATREELLAGKLSPTEILSRATFKNYTPGNPSHVIYVKNLAKGVTTEDLIYIFGAFFHNAEDIDSQLKVKLMQEGRMRGQAFITFPSVELAEDALVSTHGFMLKGKPMIVHFGRNPS